MTGVRARNGVALIASLAVVLVVSVLVIGAILTTQIELFVTRNDATAAQARYVAQAGLQTYKAALFQNFRFLESGGAGTGSLADQCSNSLANGIDFNRDGTATAWVNNTMTLPIGQVRDTNNAIIGTFAVTIIRDPGNRSRLTVRSVGTTTAADQTRQATSTARTTVVIRNSSVLEQAIFAGEGSGMRFVNGNTTVYGGVYIVGNRSNPDELVFDSNGNFSMFNAYNKTTVNDAGTLRGFLVEDAMQSQNLCAALRVESGRIAIGGSTQLGTEDVPLLTAAIGRGLDDIDISRGGTLNCGANKGVCVESAVGPFDIAEPPDFPRLDVSPGTELCPTTTWRTCIRDEATADGIVIENVGGVPSLLAPSGETLPAQCVDFLAAGGATQTGQLSFDTAPIDCTVEVNGTRFGFEYTTVGGVGSFKTHGNVNLRGYDVAFDRATTYQALSRDDLGGTQKFSNLSVETADGKGGSFIAGNNFVADSTYGAFPDNVLSIVAEDTVRLRGGNNTYVTAPVYAGNQFRIRGQTQLYGQVIANEFCTTSNQPGCSAAGTPAEIVFVPTGENRARSYRAVASTGGLPTFTVEVYEMR